MGALRCCVVSDKGPKSTPKKRRKRVAGQGEMLLPIPGKKGKEVAAKPAARPKAG